MRKILLFMLGVLMALPAFARDFSYTYEGQTIKYTVIDENAKTVRSKKGYHSGGNYFSGNYISGNLVLPSNPKDGDVEYTLIEIGDYSFSTCYGLTSVTIPNSVTSIGEWAFFDCRGLTSVIIPNSVTSIGSSAFYGCSGITSVTIGNSVTSIGERAFKGCSSLTSVTIPNSVTSIGRYAFNYCSSLTSVTIPNSLSELSEGVFCENPALKTVTIPNSVTSIGSSAFDGCSGMTSLNIGSSVKFIRDSAFKRCGKLTAVTIPNSVSEIGSNAFWNCSSLKNFALEDGTDQISIGENVLLNAHITDLYIGRDCNTEGRQLGTGIYRVTFGNSVTMIPDNAFKDCRWLESVTFGSSVETIGAEAFANCNLTEVVLPPATKTIGENAFKRNNIKHIAMGANVTEIGSYAFDGANYPLEDVSITALTPPTADDNSFSYYRSPLYVIPSEDDVVKNAYGNSATCWYRFTSRDLVPIKELSIFGQSTIGLKPGESAKLVATFSPADASLPYIFWRSSNPDVATVDNEGNVTMVADNNGSDEVASCQIIAMTLYADGPVASVTVPGDGSFVEVIYADTSISSTRSNDIYTLQGVCVKRNATDEDVKALTPGLYIIGGKKVMVK